MQTPAPVKHDVAGGEGLIPQPGFRLAAGRLSQPLVGGETFLQCGEVGRRSDEHEHVIERTLADAALGAAQAVLATLAGLDVVLAPAGLGDGIFDELADQLDQLVGHARAQVQGCHVARRRLVGLAGVVVCSSWPPPLRALIDKPTAIRPQALRRLALLLVWWPFLAILLAATIGGGWLRRRIRQ